MSAELEKFRFASGNSGYKSERKEQNPRGPGTYPVTTNSLPKVCAVTRFWSHFTSH